MRDFLSELTALAAQRRPPASETSLAAWEQRTGHTLPEEVRRVYLALDGGDFAGDVKLHAFSHIAGQDPQGPVEVGTRGPTKLLMLARGAFPLHAGGASLPSWMEQLSPETFVFALKDAEGPLKPARTLEGVLDRVLPPRETETFGETTFARGMHAVQEALSSLPEELESALRVLVPPRPRGKRPAAATSRTRKPAAKARKPTRSTSTKKGRGAKRATAKPKAKKPVRKVPSRRSAAPKSAAKKKPTKVARGAGRRPTRKASPRKPSRVRR